VVLARERERALEIDSTLATLADFGFGLPLRVRKRDTPEAEAVRCRQRREQPAIDSSTTALRDRRRGTGVAPKIARAKLRNSVENMKDASATSPSATTER
jgi:hypothetical protein